MAAVGWQVVSRRLVVPRSAVVPFVTVVDDWPAVATRQPVDWQVVVALVAVDSLLIPRNEVLNQLAVPDSHAMPYPNGGRYKCSRVDSALRPVVAADAAATLGLVVAAVALLRLAPRHY